MTDQVDSSAEPWSERRRVTYEYLLARSGEPGYLAELWLRRGSAIFDRDIPYLLVALRRMAIDEHRHERRQTVLTERLGRIAARAPFTEADPAEIVAAHSNLLEVVQALSSLEEQDAWALWWHAAGLDDDEIATR